jgi:hypothetical protein
MKFFFAVVSLLLTLFVMFPVYANTLRIMEGAALEYKYARIGSAGGAQTGGVTFTIVSLSQTAITLQVNATSTSQVSLVHINYDDGIPTYAERLEALVYLPPECVAKSLQGNLDWIANIESGTLATVANKTSQTQNFTVAAGSFQTLNLTLSLVGWEYGTLTLIYSVDSGVLVYENWIPSPYGDIITQELTAVTYPFTAEQTVLDILLPTATLIMPIATTVGGAHKSLHRNGRKRETPTENRQLQNNLQKTPFYIGLTGALLILVSVSLPWSQFMGLQVYLPSSLPTLIARSQLLSMSTFTFVVTSLLAHASATISWVGIAMEIFTKRKPVAQLVVTVSALVAFTSTIILAQAEWPLSWGPSIITAGGILVLTSAFAIWGKKGIVRLKRSGAPIPLTLKSPTSMT